MEKKLTHLALATALAAANVASIWAAEKTTPTLTPEDAVLTSVTATVQAVDLAKRELTLKGPLGNVATLSVDKSAKRLDEVKVGDEITADYYVALAAEVRPPTAEEKESPLTVLDTKAKAPKGIDPAAGGLRMFKVVTTVEGLDRPTKSLSLKGPMGNYVTTRVKDPAKLEKLRLAVTIVVTYAEALAVLLEKRAPKEKP
jgi:hypothetical protein